MDCSFTAHRVCIDGDELFVRQIRGDKSGADSSVLVFLHDSWGCTETWGDFPQQLVQESGLSAWVYDRRGYGKSSPDLTVKRSPDYLHAEADILIRLLNHFNIQRAVLYGHSDGASIALIAAALHPAKIHSVLVEGAHSFVEARTMKAVQDARDRSLHNSLLEKLEKYHGSNAAVLFRLWHEIWLDPDFSSWTIVPLLPQIQCPVLAFQGEYDEFGTVEQLQAIAQTVNGPVCTAEIPGAGHTPRKESPEATWAVIRDFLRTFVL